MDEASRSPDSSRTSSMGLALPSIAAVALQLTNSTPGAALKSAGTEAWATLPGHQACNGQHLDYVFSCSFTLLGFMSLPRPLGPESMHPCKRLFK